MQLSLRHKNGRLDHNDGTNSENGLIILRASIVERSLQKWVCLLRKFDIHIPDLRKENVVRIARPRGEWWAALGDLHGNTMVPIRVVTRLSSGLRVLQDAFFMATGIIDARNISHDLGTPSPLVG